MDALGGIHEFYPGTGYREDSDMGLRMDQAGFDVRSAPSASVDHIASRVVREHGKPTATCSTVSATTSCYSAAYSECGAAIYVATSSSQPGRLLTTCGRSNSALSRIPASSSSRLRLLAGGVSRAGAKHWDWWLGQGVDRIASSSRSAASVEIKNLGRQWIRMILLANSFKVSRGATLIAHHSSFRIRLPCVAGRRLQSRAPTPGRRPA